MFEQGRLAFERQDYAQALEAFEAAHAARMDGPAIHFNIGVAAYRAGAYDKARAAFERVALTPAMAALAHYNLGLVALAQNDEQQAIDWFVRVYADSPDERLRSLARTQLDAIATAPEVESKRFWWAVYAATGVGYDDNVTLTSNDQTLGIASEGDVYGDALVAASVQLSDAWRIDVDASWLNYVDLNEFDQWGVGSGVRYRIALEPWMLDVGVQLGTTYLDGERFDLRESMYVQAVSSFSNALALRTRYRATNIDATDEYPGLGGSSHELMARLTKQVRTWTLGATYAFELNDYDSDVISAQRHRASVDLRVPFARAWVARASMSYRHSDYEDPEMGTERRMEAGAGLEFLLSNRWALTLRYVFTDNDATAPEFTYRRNRVFLGVELTL